MKNDITELVFILDRSGSMAGLESDTVGGFNALIGKQKQQDGACFVSTVLFDHESLVLHDRVKLEEVPPMTDRDYTVRGCTALLDAIGDAVHHIENIHKYARPEDVPEHTLFVITTDGMENASHRYHAEQIKQLIGRKKEADGWEFLFLGANIDAVAAAGKIGIAEDRAVRYHSDSVGTQVNYAAMSDAVTCVRAHRKLTGGWKKRVEADFAARGEAK